MNNFLGYERADEFFGKLVQLVQDVMPGSVLIRKDGGKLVVLRQRAVTDSEVEAVITRLEPTIDHLHLDSRLELRHELEKSLKSLVTGDNSPSLSHPIGWPYRMPPTSCDIDPYWTSEELFVRLGV